MGVLKLFLNVSNYNKLFKHKLQLFHSQFLKLSTPMLGQACFYGKRSLFIQDTNRKRLRAQEFAVDSKRFGSK